MSADEPISEWVEAEARSPRRDLDPAFVWVDRGLAEALATAHTRTFEVVAVDTKLGEEQLTADIPNAKSEHLEVLDPSGLIREGTEVGPGNVLIGKVTPKGGGPLSAEEKLLRSIFGEKAGDVRDSSLRCPPGCAGVVETSRMVATQNKGEVARAEVVIAWQRPLAIGDELVIGGPGSTTRVTVAGIDDLGSAQLEWAGRSGALRVAKASMVEALIHARSIGPYSIVTQQPLRTREQFGGQRLSARQAAALAAAAPWAAWEMFTIKSDSVAGRVRAYESLVRQKNIELPVAPEPEPEPTPKPEGGSAMRDVFSFFEKPRGHDVEPGDVPAEVPESVEVLARELAALMIEVRFTTPSLGARLLSSEEIRTRSHGEVRKPETINYRTYKPERDGLFCMRIFGPVQDYECACGKYKRMKHRGITCEKCGVEVIQSKVRRERFGHVALPIPVVHPLFKPTFAKLLGRTPDELDAVIRGQAGFDEAGSYARLEANDDGSFETGGWGLRHAVAALGAGPGGVSADLLLLDVIPVLPPDLRPLVPLDGGRFATSDLNDLYRRVINRRNRLARLIELNAPAIILHNESFELQKAVDQLFDNEHQPKPVKFQSRTLHSIGRLAAGHFAQLVRRNVDYSGVTRFVVDPELGHGRCRLPRRMAIELFKPMAYGILEAKGFVNTIKAAKAAVEQGLEHAVEAIAEASVAAPVLLATEAALVAREVELWDEAAIAVDPATARLLAGSDGLSSVCVHLPLSTEARDELANFDDVALDGEARGESGGWFSAAVFEGEGLARVVDAVLEEAHEAIESPLLEAALGRGPSDGFSPPPRRRRSTRSPIASRTKGVAAQDEDDDYDF